MNFEQGRGIRGQAFLIVVIGENILTQRRKDANVKNRKSGIRGQAFLIVVIGRIKNGGREDGDGKEGEGERMRRNAGFA